MSSLLAETSVFESYNARALRPSQVAATFVPSNAFEQLAQRRHSVVLGPRGSGKTTLLKMLQPAALEAWNHHDAPKYCEQIDFTGVFVPFDRSWRAQIDALGASAGEPMQEVLGRAAFTTHALRALTSAFLSRIAPEMTPRAVRHVEMSPRDQAELARHLYSAWSLNDGPKSLLGLKMALGNRLALIGSVGTRLTIEHSELQADERNALFCPFLEQISTALDAWELITGLEDERWALLLDELELAPPKLKQDIFRNLRSSDPRLLFKLALSPFDSEVPFDAGPTDPQRGQDYDSIALWYSLKRGTQEFCTQLWHSMLRDLDLPATQPRAAFGRSAFETEESEWRQSPSGSAYGAGSRAQRNFAQLQRRDASFAKYLIERGYDAHKLDRVPPAGRAAEIRKISPLVEARLFFRRVRDPTEAGATHPLGRKRLTLYSGWETLCAISEGNPRWFIGIVKQLLDSAGSDGLRIGQSKQAQAIEAASDRYMAALRTIPVTSKIARQKSGGLMTILASIGEYFRKHQITDDFTPEPAGSFTVDADSSQDLVDALGQALNAGAIVIVNESSDTTGLEDLRGRRFRLCYLLVAHFQAMPRLGRPVSLKRILADSDFESREPVQLELE